MAGSWIKLTGDDVDRDSGITLYAINMDDVSKVEIYGGKFQLSFSAGSSATLAERDGELVKDWLDRNGGPARNFKS